jgi:hypothetical protein
MNVLQNARSSPASGALLASAEWQNVTPLIVCTFWKSIWYFTRSSYT